MRLKYFGDKHDGPKWSFIREEIRSFNFFYVPMFTDFAWEEDDSALKDISDMRAKIIETVEKEVRSYLEKLLRKKGFFILFKGYKKKDSNYFNELFQMLQKKSDQKKYLFFDPDTGIEPKTPKDEHLKFSSLIEVSKHLKAKDIVLIYQHQARTTSKDEDFKARRGRITEHLGKYYKIDTKNIDSEASSYFIKLERK